MSKAVFLDTAGWLALINRRDQLHVQAVEVYRNLGSVARVTTDAVLIETCNALSKTSLRPLARAFMQKIEEAEKFGVLKVVYVTRDLLAQGWKLFKGRPDKEWSLTDCISFVVMKRRRCQKAFTSDHHFVQAGFECLLQV
ncbi:MAG: PIN domain-containing protein [Bacillota bacterium]